MRGAPAYQGGCGKRHFPLPRSKMLPSSQYRCIACSRRCEGHSFSIRTGVCVLRRFSCGFRMGRERNLKFLNTGIAKLYIYMYIYISECTKSTRADGRFWKSSIIVTQTATVQIISQPFPLVYIYTHIHIFVYTYLCLLLYKLSLGFKSSCEFVN